MTKFETCWTKLQASSAQKTKTSFDTVHFFDFFDFFDFFIRLEDKRAASKKLEQQPVLK